MKNLGSLILSVIKESLFSCRHSVMSKYFNLDFSFFFMEKDHTLIRDLLEQLQQSMMFLGTQERSTLEAKMQTFQAVLEPLKT